MPPAAVLINSRRVAFSNMQAPCGLGSELDSVIAMCYEYGSVILSKGWIGIHQAVDCQEICV